MKKFFEAPSVCSVDLSLAEDVMTASTLASKKDGVGYGKVGFADTSSSSDLWKGAGEGWI